MSIYADLIANFGLVFARTRPDLAIPGSPERCLTRVVIEDEGGGLWLLESLAGAQQARRQGIGELLAALDIRGLASLAPYRMTRDGAFVLCDWASLWQLSPFIQGVELARPGFLGDAWRGEQLADWLADLAQAGAGVDIPAGLRDLDLPAFARELLDTLADCRPDVHARLARIMPSLTDYLAAWPTLPRRLSHGDVHPLNVVWSEDAIGAVIDWEFAGLLPLEYDAVNCLGCLAVEGGGFDTPFTRAFLARLDTREYWGQGSRASLGPAILATRLGWLSEWLRRDDAEMTESELDFMDYLAALPNPFA